MSKGTVRFVSRNQSINRIYDAVAPFSSNEMLEEILMSYLEEKGLMVDVANYVEDFIRTMNDEEE